jgi:hypothetical protein
MSRDAHPTALHLHASHHADLFEDFCRPPSSYAPGHSNTNSTLNTTLPPTSSNPAYQGAGNANTIPNTDPSTNAITLPGHYLPYESIPLPPELEPLNPEDEDGVVPDMHAAFGIMRALGGTGDGTGASAGAAVNGISGPGGGGVGEESRAGLHRGEGIWRDLGLQGVLDGGNGPPGRSVNGLSSGLNGSRRGAAREGRRPVLLR